MPAIVNLYAYILQNTFFGRTILEENNRKKTYKMRPNDDFWAIFECLPPQFLAIYYAFAFLFEEKSSQIRIRNYKEMSYTRFTLGQSS